MNIPLITDDQKIAPWAAIFGACTLLGTFALSAIPTLIFTWPALAFGLWLVSAFLTVFTTALNDYRPWKTFPVKYVGTWIWFVIVLPVLMPWWIVIKIGDSATWCYRGLTGFVKRRFTPAPPLLVPSGEPAVPAEEFVVPSDVIFEFNSDDPLENLPEITWSDDPAEGVPPVNMKQAYCEAMLRDPEIAWEGKLVDVNRRLNEAAGSLQALERRLLSTHAEQVILKQEQLALVSAGKPAPFPAGHKAQLEHDFDCLMSLRNVAAVRVMDNILKVWVPVVTVKVADKTHDLGGYEIQVHLLSGRMTVKCLRLTYGEYHHPHPYSLSSDNICVGNRRDRMAEFLKARNFAPAVGLMVEAMHHVNPGEEDRIVGLYPEFVEVKP